MESAATILHADLDAFYASVEQLLDPSLIFVGGNFREYQRLGDEAFADVAGCTHLFGSPEEIAQKIRHRVRVELGLPISVGVARTKHLAKIASQVAKPDGLVVVEEGTEIAFLHGLPVGLMWGVGPATETRLADAGITTIGQLANANRHVLERLLGLDDEKHRPGTRKGQARWGADRAIDAIRERFGWEAVGYALVALGRAGSVPDAFRELAEKGL